MILVVAVCVLLAGGSWAVPWRRRRLTRVPAGGEQPRSASGADGRPATVPAPSELDVELLIVVLESALAAGAPPARALSVVGSRLGGVRGGQLARAGIRMSLGAEPLQACADGSPAVQRIGAALADAMTAGASPVPSLRAERARSRRQRRDRVDRAAASLGVWLVLPLGLAYLPAFMLLGLVPTVLSLARTLLTG